MSVSATIPDWTREAPQRPWDPGRKLVRSVRAYTDASGVLTRKLAVLRHRFWSAVTSAELPLTGFLGGGLLLPHPAGIVIHPAVVLGPNCLVMQNVTIGSNGEGGLPRLGGHVDVGPGAVILGPVTIGDHAVIGANAVVLSDVPAGGVAVGVPANVVRVRDTTAQDS